MKKTLLVPQLVEYHWTQARKQWQCRTCSKVIEPGEMYWGVFSILAICESCGEIIKRLPPLTNIDEAMKTGR